MAKIRVKALESGARLRVHGLTPPVPPVTELIAKATNNASWDNMGWYHNDIRAIFDPDTRAFIPYDSTKIYTITDSSWNGASRSQSDAFWGQIIEGLSLVNNSGNLCVKNASGAYANRSGFKYTAEEKPSYTGYFNPDHTPVTVNTYGSYVRKSDGAFFKFSSGSSNVTITKFCSNGEWFDASGILAGALKQNSYYYILMVGTLSGSRSISAVEFISDEIPT